LTDEEIGDILRGGGYIDAAASDFNRMKLDGSTIVAGDDIFIYNPKKPDVPAFQAQIVQPPEEYQGKWFNAEAAQIANRPDIADSMCKSYYDNPQQARKYSEDGASCDACPFHPFHKSAMPGTDQAKCSWKGDLRLRIIPENGELTGEEPVWTLTLSTTGMIEYRGASREPQKGSVSEYNFLYQLSRLAESKAEEWGVTPKQAVMMALNAYQAGGVAANVRVLRATNDEGSRSWSVPSFEPFHIEESFAVAPQTEDAAEAPAAAAIAEVRTVSGEVLDGTDPLPF
jgi:hypothetical protein